LNSQGNPLRGIQKLVDPSFEESYQLKQL